MPMPSVVRDVIPLVFQGDLKRDAPVEAIPSVLTYNYKGGTNKDPKLHE